LSFPGFFLQALAKITNARSVFAETCYLFGNNSLLLTPFHIFNAGRKVGENAFCRVMCH
jgi:hypothetical protein